MPVGDTFGHPRHVIGYIMGKKDENTHSGPSDEGCRECRAAAYELASLALLAVWAVWMLVRILALAADPNSFATYLPAFPLLLLSVSAELMADSEAAEIQDSSMREQNVKEPINRKDT